MVGSPYFSFEIMNVMSCHALSPCHAMSPKHALSRSSHFLTSDPLKIFSTFHDNACAVSVGSYVPLPLIMKKKKNRVECDPSEGLGEYQ